MSKEQPVPHFSPTAEEWSDDFAAFVRKILPQIKAYGGCTITPPASWAWSPPPLDLAQAVKPIQQHLFRAGSGMSGCYTGIFEESRPTPLSDYMAQAERSQPTSADPEAVQSQYWRRVVTGEQGIMYGSDTDTASLFDPALAEWNLSRLPAGTEGDLLRHLPLSIPGLNKPMLYFGGWRSTFCLHTEDSELGGLSFLHQGAPKFWYAAPPEWDPSPDPNPSPSPNPNPTPNLDPVQVHCAARVRGARARPRRRPLLHRAPPVRTVPAA